MIRALIGLALWLLPLAAHDRADDFLAFRRLVGRRQLGNHVHEDLKLLLNRQEIAQIRCLGPLFSAYSQSGPGLTHAATDAPGQTNGMPPPLSWISVPDRPTLDRREAFRAVAMYALTATTRSDKRIRT